MNESNAILPLNPLVGPATGATMGAAEAGGLGASAEGLKSLSMSETSWLPCESTLKADTFTAIAPGTGEEVSRAKTHVENLEPQGSASIPNGAEDG